VKYGTQKTVLRAGLLAALPIAVCFFLPTSSASDKIKIEDLVAKHLQAIGSVSARTSLAKRIIAGTSKVTFRTQPAGQATGRAVMASDGVKSLIGMSFTSPVYPREQFGFDGNNFMAAYVTPGVRSVLGEFLMTHGLIFKQGLMGGTLSTAWPLLDLSIRNPRLEYAGLRTVDSRRLHELRYLARGGADLQVNLFFEPSDFRHVRTEYKRVIAAGTEGRQSLNIQETEIRYRMVEEFSDFRSEAGLTLPHSYKINLLVDSKGGTFQADWEITLNQFVFNQLIDKQSFTIAAYRRTACHYNHL